MHGAKRYALLIFAVNFNLCVMVERVRGIATAVEAHIACAYSVDGKGPPHMSLSVFEVFPNAKFVRVVVVVVEDGVYRVNEILI